jgi:hypothetical protein
MNPVRIVVFNTAANWSRAVSEEIADGLTRRLAIEEIDITPLALEAFLDRHGSRRPVELPLPLVRGAA